MNKYNTVLFFLLGFLLKSFLVIGQPDFSYHPDPEIEKVATTIKHEQAKILYRIEDTTRYIKSEHIDFMNGRSYWATFNQKYQTNDTIWYLSNKEIIALSEAIVKKTKKKYRIEEFQLNYLTYSKYTIKARIYLSSRKLILKTMFTSNGSIRIRECIKKVYIQERYKSLIFDRSNHKTNRKTERITKLGCEEWYFQDF